MDILGISLGTTTIGIAVINERELAESNIHSFRAIWSDKKASTIISRIASYLHTYSVHFVVVKLPPHTHQPPTILQLMAMLTELCNLHGCMVSVCTKEDLKQHIPGAKNHSDIMHFVVEHYPITTMDFKNAKKRKNNYHNKLFDAVAAAHIGKIKGG
jgi:hypothetical protein